MAAWEYFTSQKQWEAYLKDLLKLTTKHYSELLCWYTTIKHLKRKTKVKVLRINCIGFSKIDAKEMGDIARKIKANKALTKGELAKSRNKMQKYWKQLMIISKKQAEAKKLQEQKELEAKLAEEELAAQKEDAEKLERFRQDIETLRKCSEEGISCEYGICDECPITTGFQLRFKC